MDLPRTLQGGVPDLRSGKSEDSIVVCLQPPVARAVCGRLVFGALVEVVPIAFDDETALPFIFAKPQQEVYPIYANLMLREEPDRAIVVE